MPSADPGSPDSTLNPTQQATLDALGAGTDIDTRPEAPADLGARLRSDLESGLADAAATIAGDHSVTITKHLLNGVHGCQARFLDEQSRPFEPTVAIVRGTVAHKALELAVHWQGTPLPLDLIDAAISSVEATDHWATDWVLRASDAERAELRGQAGDIIAKFLECWPPITAAMRPTTEARMFADLCGGRITLKGQVDLTLGQPVGSGTRARKIIVDYKTGGFSPEHRSDLRFYALVETLRLGVPPRLLVSSYLAAGTIETEAVTEAMLDATVARVVDGVETYLALRAREIEPKRRPSVACRWCPIAEDCEPGQAFLADSDSFV